MDTDELDEKYPLSEGAEASPKQADPFACNITTSKQSSTLTSPALIDDVSEVGSEPVATKEF